MTPCSDLWITSGSQWVPSGSGTHWPEWVPWVPLPKGGPTEPPAPDHTQTSTPPGPTETP